MSWSIEISDAAHEDLRDIYSYIAFELRSPENARNVLRRILAQVATLDEMPERFALTRESRCRHAAFVSWMSATSACTICRRMESFP